jgi:hypothetical protein
MRIRKRYLIGVLLIIVCLLVVTLPRVQAQTSNGYDLTWNTAEGGGMSGSTGAGYNLTGTFGQTDASSTQLSGDTYKLEGGFWLGAITSGIFLPVITK